MSFRDECVLGIGLIHLCCGNLRSVDVSFVPLLKRFVRLTALSVAYLEPPNRTPSALLDEKIVSSSDTNETSTDLSV